MDGVGGVGGVVNVHGQRHTVCFLWLTLGPISSFSADHKYDQNTTMTFLLHNVVLR